MHRLIRSRGNAVVALFATSLDLRMDIGELGWHLLGHLTKVQQGIEVRACACGAATPRSVTIRDFRFPDLVSPVRMLP